MSKCAAFTKYRANRRGERPCMFDALPGSTLCGVHEREARLAGQAIPESSQLVRTGLHSCQVCVPEEWTDEQAMRFATREAPLAAPFGWRVVLDEQYVVNRYQCAVRLGCVHINLRARGEG